VILIRARRRMGSFLHAGVQLKSHLSLASFSPTRLSRQLHWWFPIREAPEEIGRSLIFSMTLTDRTGEMETPKLVGQRFADVLNNLRAPPICANSRALQILSNKSPANLRCTGSSRCRNRTLVDWPNYPPARLSATGTEMFRERTKEPGIAGHVQSTFERSAGKELSFAMHGRLARAFRTCASAKNVLTNGRRADRARSALCNLRQSQRLRTIPTSISILLLTGVLLLLPRYRPKCASILSRVASAHHRGQQMGHIR